MHYIWCSRPPNSERDITDTRSRYANRKLYITLNCCNAFQIWRITDIDNLYRCRNNSIISIAIFHASSVGLSYSFVCTSFSFFISIELATKRTRYIYVSICNCLMFHMIYRYRILVNAYFKTWSFSRLTAVIRLFSSTDLIVKILFQDPLDVWKLSTRE